MKLFSIFFLLAAALHAGPKVGTPFPTLSLENQFEKQQTVSAMDTLVLISFERDVSDAVHSFLNTQPKDFLPAHHAKYVSDISAMPSIISKLFALPKMRDYSYSLMLNREDDFKQRFDAREGKLTVYRLKEGVVASVDFIDPATVGNLFKE